MTASITVLCLLGIAAATLALSVKRIPEGKVYTLHRRHDAQPELLTAGTHWIVPLRDHIAHKISLTGRTLRLDETLTDGRHLQGAVYWQVLDPARADAVIDQADAHIRQHLLDSLRDGSDDARLKAQLNTVLRPQGLLITRVDTRLGAAVSTAA